MAPKGTQQEKKSAKVKVDKTFGMKNKKGAKAQQEVSKLKRQDAEAGNPKLRKEAEDRKRAAEQKKKDAEARKAELNELFNTVQPVQKVPFGVDPKTVLCAFFKAGKCEKGSKCKFSHDLDADRRTTKKDIYTDVRDKEKEDDTMDKWDEAKLRSVVLSKTGNPKTTTEIVCKYFLEAVETQKYGWFWICPNGGDNCQYRHSLPPGFVLKSKEKKKDEKEKVSLEQFLETERHKIAGEKTPVTLESFTKWKNERVAKKQAVEDEDRKQKEQRRAAGKMTGLSGREVFAFNPDLLDDYDEDEDEEFDLTQYMKDRRSDAGSDDDGDEEEGDEDEDSESVTTSIKGSVKG
ncbi:putative CCCH finger DNA binding protein [Taphrina deformans PYCC 5710]|uniref:Zinc finger CCCH domain-containing protein 15 n=1 Tax=Taphrina deformans (strain PYCC 5710 / ATCC 11124 / CBS 356.35 / IMI 108563 / JCM 9778 / NBRC 8474) TaxID=1097556 RepID=R4XCR7_TAPDE|nr:putative CCCH finger DNA binding protein [Taphrina deformans PYCC 5710]|eukprot:CCG82181.1 putative CCCH finger DNA binding protein [Taphrina deformans PYCC 5710]